MAMDILFGGIPAFALELIRAGHHLRGIALPYLDDEPELWELFTVAHSHRIPLWPATVLTEEASSAEREAVAAAGPCHVLLTMCFDCRVAEWARLLCPHGAWNLHPSLLPRHRGYNPYYWTIRCGDAVSGVTLHHMTQRFDAGDIILQQPLDVQPHWTSGLLSKELNQLSVPLVLRALDALERGEALPRHPQPSEGITHAPQPEAEELEVDFGAPLTETLRKIRAATPEPGAFMTVAGQRLVIRGVREGPPPPAGAKPRDAFTAEGQVYLCAPGGSFRPLVMDSAAECVDLAQLLEL